VANSIARPDDILQQGLVFVGGTVFVKGGLQIDATLKDVRVVAADNKPIVLTALGTMQNCSIEGADVLVAGTFSGQVLARGDVEVTDTAEFSGSIRSSGVVVVNPLAGDADEITIGRLPPEAPITSRLRPWSSPFLGLPRRRCSTAKLPTVLETEPITTWTFDAAHHPAGPA